MNDGQFAALLQEVIVLRLVLVHLLARQSPEELAALAADIDAKPELTMHPDVETALIPLRAKVDELLVQSKLVQRQRS